MKRTIILMLITVATISPAFGQQSKAKAAEEERTSLRARVVSSHFTLSR